jgi:hypothetical protein
VKVVCELTAKQRRQIPAYRRKWQAVALAIAPVDCRRVESAIRNLSHEIELNPPEEFIYYASPAAAWADFSTWFPRIGRCLVAYWSYQLPLFDPRSCWRKWGENRDVIDLAVRRGSEPNRIWIGRPSREDIHGNMLDPAINREIWAAFDNLADRDWAWRIVRDIAVRFPEEHERLLEKADGEDPSNPIDVAEYVYLGPFHWLIQELACVDFCQAVLGCRTNAALYGSLTDLVCCGSVLLIFESVCLICERPTSVLGGPVLARYGDGYTVI